LFFNEIKPAAAGFATLNMAGTLFINRASCAVAVSREGLIEVAKLGRVAGHSHEARARQAEKLRRHAAEVKAWSPSEQLGWLTVEVFLEKIQPYLAGITAAAISSALDISQPYAAEILRRSICAASTPLADACTARHPLRGRVKLPSKKGYGSGKSTICLSPARDAKRRTLTWLIRC
jgi:hypothetical protein